MTKRIATLAMALAFTVVTVGVAYSFTCDVLSIEGTKVTLECKEKYIKKLEVGKKAKVSPKKARKAAEGC
jgi:hypothetical protein